MAFPALAPSILKAILAFFGFGVTVAAVASPSPKQAVLRRQLARATSGATIAPPRYQLSGPVVVNNSGQVAGSGDLPDSIDPAAPGAALQEIARLDSRWGAAVEAYRALHNSRPSQAQIDLDQGRVYRFPTRWALLRATVDSLVYDDPLAEKWGESYAITDPTTNEISPEWLEMLSLYSPSDDDWEATAAYVEDHYNKAPAPGVLDYLSGLVDAARDVVGIVGNVWGGEWGEAVDGVDGLVRDARQAGNSGGSGIRTRSAQLSREEMAILSTLRAWSRPVQVEQLSGGVKQLTRTAQEALSGGGTPLDRGVSSLGGRAAIALRLRGLPELTAASKLLSDDALVLKAALIARRWPTVGASSIGDWPYSAVPRPTKTQSLNSQAADPFASGQADVRDQSQGTNSQYVGPQQ